MQNFCLKLKKVGNTTRPFKYDLNQIPYDYTVKVTNIFKGVHLVDRVPESVSDLVFVNCIELFYLWLQRTYQSDFSIDHLVMSMCIVNSCVVEKNGVCCDHCVLLIKLC